jgi:hypothetical protein
LYVEANSRSNTKRTSSSFLLTFETQNQAADAVRKLHMKIHRPRPTEYDRSPPEKVLRADIVW